MTTLNDVEKGVEILTQYVAGDTRVNCQLETFIVSWGPTPESLPADERDQLQRLGWIYNDGFEGWILPT